ncbi:LysR family transcriptional regulator [Xenorhabdus littoralis]|uniref:LysR family transcriptional regulator n=1 Tax=Xenorhabdus littoralis TaxID=2582835 RepID=UPI0029E7F187|nr:LysR family transcriptional regulator [Xenorhabdus sp. psl]MDX7991955.1 LysR family transcriptional regulator [Xenorhabdus sp. psl]
MQPHLNRIQTFLAVVECGSFTRAAERLFISKAVASIHVKALEEALNVPLLIRNTRGLALTEAGNAFYQDFKVIFDNIQNAFDNVAERHYSLAGRLRITSTTEFGEKFLLPLISQFCTIYPRLEVSYFADSTLNNLITEKIDLAIRLGTLSDSALKSRGKAKYTSNTSSAIRSLAMSALGIAVLPEWIIASDLESGDLVELFPEYELPRQDVTVIFPNNTQLQHKSRLSIKGGACECLINTTSPVGRIYVSYLVLLSEMSLVIQEKTLYKAEVNLHPILIT